MRSFAALAVLLGCAAPGCTARPEPKGCTLLPCYDRLAVVFEKTNAWPAGSYAFTFDADGSRATCTATLPLPACGAGPAVVCDPEGVVSLGTSDCAMTPGLQSFDEAWFVAPPAPQRVGVTVTRDGQRFFESTLVPAYKKDQPNGEGCAPVCREGREVWKVPDSR